MILTKENLETIPAKEQAIIEYLLDDLEVINNYIDKELHIDWQDYHNEYSPERVDPCPDYYGCYRLYNDLQFVGVEMDIDTLDTVICTLYNIFVE
jgi:hypothetical protein